MRSLVYYCLAVAVTICALGYVRGWFGPPKQVNTVVLIDNTKYEDDKEAFRISVEAKAKAIKDQIASLDQKSGNLIGDEKARAQQNLIELQSRHLRLEGQIKKMNDAGVDQYEIVKTDLSKSLADVEKQLEELKAKIAGKSGA